MIVEPSAPESGAGVFFFFPLTSVVPAEVPSVNGDFLFVDLGFGLWAFSISTFGKNGFTAGVETSQEPVTRPDGGLYAWMG